jgi:hypothetical protein
MRPVSGATAPPRGPARAPLRARSLLTSPAPCLAALAIGAVAVAAGGWTIPFWGALGALAGFSLSGSV